MHESIRRTCSRLRSVINLETIRFCGILFWGGLLMCDTAHAQMSRELELQVQAISAVLHRSPRYSVVFKNLSLKLGLQFGSKTVQVEKKPYS